MNKFFFLMNYQRMKIYHPSCRQIGFDSRKNRFQWFNDYGDFNDYLKSFVVLVYNQCWNFTNAPSYLLKLVIWKLCKTVYRGISGMMTKLIKHFTGIFRQVHMCENWHNFLKCAPSIHIHSCSVLSRIISMKQIRLWTSLSQEMGRLIQKITSQTTIHR